MVGQEFGLRIGWFYSASNVYPGEKLQSLKFSCGRGLYQQDLKISNHHKMHNIKNDWGWIAESLGSRAALEEDPEPTVCINHL